MTLSLLRDMLEKYPRANADETRDALKEIAQELTLLALDRGGFFADAAFYGGTALRIFHGLDRFSEDLDFSLTAKNPGFDLEDFLPFVRDELRSFGFEMTVEKRRKTKDSAIQSAFIKGNTLVHLMKVAAPAASGVPGNEVLKIKIEVDTDPPADARYEVRYGLRPFPYSVRLFDPPSLFAGKIHALLCRNWKNRVKGRDFYDYVVFLGKGVPVNLPHLRSRLSQSQRAAPGGREALVAMLEARFAAVDFEQAKADVLPFIRNSDAVRLWSAAFFRDITRDGLKIEDYHEEKGDER